MMSKPLGRCLLFVILQNLLGAFTSGCAAQPVHPVVGSDLATTDMARMILAESAPVNSIPSLSQPVQSRKLADAQQPSPPLSTAAMLDQSWVAYRQRFIQADGRVIDWEQNARTVSEGQAYAMLRAVFADDPATFALTLQWAEENLARRDANAQPIDSLWAWLWGQTDQNTWEILDANFASDADLDAVTALILASRRWNRPDYLELARVKLKDLWERSTVTLPPATGTPTGTSTRTRSRTAPVPTSARYFLPGPVEAFQPNPPVAYFNPSYLAPYAFRLFAQVDPQRDWLSLVDSSYEILEQSAQLSAVNLPSDWVALNLATGQYQAPPSSSRLRPTYSFDAFRVWWRVALDAAWFNEPRATAFLQSHLVHLQTLWQTHQAIPARINLRGFATARYGATSQYAMLYPALQLIDPVMAEEIRQQKLIPTYNNGIWDNDSAYYVQNLAWLGLFPSSAMQEWVEAE